jgi:hypothetical protein
MPRFALMIRASYPPSLASRTNTWTPGLMKVVVVGGTNVVNALVSLKVVLA